MPTSRARQRPKIKYASQSSTTQGDPSKGKSAPNRSEFIENLAYSHYLSAFEADSAEMFRDQIQKSIDAYRETLRDYKANRKKAEVKRCEAMIRFLSYWISPSIGERRKLISASWSLTIRSFSIIRRLYDPENLAKAFSRLAIVGVIRFSLEWNPKVRRSILQQLTSLCQEIIGRRHDETSEVWAEVYAIAANCLGLATWYSEPQTRQEQGRRSKLLWQRALHVSEETALVQTGLFSNLGMFDLPIGSPGSEKTGPYLEKMVDYARKRKDKLLLSSAIKLLAFDLLFKLRTTEDPEEFNHLAERWLNLTSESDILYSTISSGLPRQSVFSIHLQTDYYLILAQHETDKTRRYALLVQAVDAARIELDIARRSGEPESTALAHHSAGKALVALAQTEENQARRMNLIRRAMPHRDRYLSMVERFSPPGTTWDRGMAWIYMAEIGCLHATIVQSKNAKKGLLSKAIRFKERGVRLCAEDTSVLEMWSSGSTLFYEVLGTFQAECGDLYLERFKVEHRSMDLERATEKFDQAVDSFRRVDLRVRVAETYWKSALAFEKGNDHARASNSFNLAANGYNIAGQRIPSLRKFYEDLAIYIQARSEVAKARDYHERREYSNARVSYERAASLYTSSKSWSYLAPYYSAWGQIEGAEEHSTRNRIEDSIQSFEEAIRLYRETDRSVTSQLSMISDENERTAAKNVIADGKASEKYSRARIRIEQARAEERKGNHDLAWKAYSLAIDQLESLTSDLAQEGRTTQDLSLLIEQCRAQQLMARAETTSSEATFNEASRLFGKAQTLSQDPFTRSVLLGHSHFCSALAVGLRLEATRQTDDYDQARRYCELASESYMKAGSSEWAEYSRATALLFDAYSYMGRVNRDSDEKKKTQLLVVVEKLLQSASESYDKTGHPAKRDHVLRLLDGVRRDRQLLDSITQTLDAFPTTSIPAPDSIQPTSASIETPERLARAYLIAEMSVSPIVSTIGEEIEVRLLITNAGGSPATILRIDRIVPESLEITRIPDSSTVEGRSLNVRGKRLGPTKSEEVRMMLRARADGVMSLKPTVVYGDINGEEFNRELDAISITVKSANAIGSVVKSSLSIGSTEYFVGEKILCHLEISTIGPTPILLEGVSDCVPEGITASFPEKPGAPSDGRIDLQGLRFEPGETHTVTWTLQGKVPGKIRLAPTISFGNGLGIFGQETVPPAEISIHEYSPILAFLTGEYRKDHDARRLAEEQSGWRTLLNIASSLKIPRSQAYGEPRYGHMFGRPIETLLRAGLIEYRTFRGKGRGGNITKVRVSHERESIRRLLGRTDLSPIFGKPAGGETAEVPAVSHKIQWGQ